jgi:hypothetical protein
MDTDGSHDGAAAEQASNGSASAGEDEATIQLRTLQQRLAEAEQETQALKDKVENAELWAKRLEDDRAKERAEFARDKLGLERRAFEQQLDSKRRLERQQKESTVGAPSARRAYHTLALRRVLARS